MSALASFSNDPITMTGPSGDDRAVAGVLGSMGEGFTMTWLAQQ